MSRVVVGADLCKGEWAAIRLRDGVFEAGAVLPNLAEVVSMFGNDASIIAVDIPLSYPPEGSKGRACEQEGRSLLGSRRSSMFDTYPRSVLLAPTHEEANRKSQMTIGCGIPQQSFALGKAIREAAILAEQDTRIHETHPELVFANLAGSLASKKSWSGFRQRLAALEHAGIKLPIEFSEMDRAAFDDVLDAAAAALAADRIFLQSARRVPADPVEPPIWF